MPNVYSYFSVSYHRWILSNFITATVISQVAHIREWAAEGRLFSLLRLFGVAMQLIQQVPSIGPDNARGPKGHLCNTRANFRPIPTI